MTITVRPLTPTDLSVAGLIAMAAYERPHSYEQVLAQYLELQSDGWYLALLDGEPAGLGGAINFGPFATLGMMSVLPALQKRGLGQALMERLLAWLDKSECPTVLLNARPGAISLYERYGFVIQEETRQFSVPAHPAHEALPPDMSLFSRSDLPTLAAFDAPAFGTERRAALSICFERAPQRVLVSKDAAGHLSGFLVANESNVGPWHAASLADARTLQRQAQKFEYTTSSFVVSFLATNTCAQTLLTEYRAKPYATLAHMRRGQPLQRDPAQRLYSMASLMLC